MSAKNNMKKLFLLTLMATQPAWPQDSYMSGIFQNSKVWLGKTSEKLEAVTSIPAFVGIGICVLFSGLSYFYAKASSDNRRLTIENNQLREQNGDLVDRWTGVDRSCEERETELRRCQRALEEAIKRVRREQCEVELTEQYYARQLAQRDGEIASLNRRLGLAQQKFKSSEMENIQLLIKLRAEQRRHDETIHKMHAQRKIAQRQLAHLSPSTEN